MFTDKELSQIVSRARGAESHPIYEDVQRQTIMVVPELVTQLRQYRAFVRYVSNSEDPRTCRGLATRLLKNEDTSSELPQAEEQ